MHSDGAKYSVSDSPSSLNEDLIMPLPIAISLLLFRWQDTISHGERQEGIRIEKGSLSAQVVSPLGKQV